MKLSLSLNKDILESSTGFLINKFKLRKRRLTLFPEDIFAEYILACEESGSGGRIFNVTRDWTDLMYQSVVPRLFKKIPAEIFLNILMKKVWVNLGILEDLKSRRKGQIIEIEIKNGVFLRLIGPNKFSQAMLEATLSNIFSKELALKDSTFDGTIARYLFEIAGEKRDCPKKKAKRTKPMGFDKIKGADLNYALKNKIFTLGPNNRIYFREKLMTPFENSLFHMLANEGPLLEKIPEISFNYFDQLIDKSASAEKKLVLLKTLIQVMGWGVPSIVLEENKVKLKIFGMPGGIQEEKDNPLFFIRTIEGYLQTVDRGFKLEELEEPGKEVSATFVSES